MEKSLYTGKNMKTFNDILEETKNKSIFEIAEQIIKDMRTLNLLLFKMQENFHLKDKIKTLRGISQETNEEIINLINRIEIYINKISTAITNEVQMEPLNKTKTDRIMINIMEQYLFISEFIQSDGIIGENYVVDLNRIHTARNNLNDAINRYNSKIANVNNWTEIISGNEAFSMAKKQINRSAE